MANLRVTRGQIRTLLNARKHKPRTGACHCTQDGHCAEAHLAADSICWVPDCAECWRERFLIAMWLDRAIKAPVEDFEP